MKFLKLKLVYFVLILTGVYPYWSIGNHSASAQESERLATTLEISGKASLRRLNNSNNLPLTVGTELYSGDLIYPEQGTEVFVECSDLSKRRFPSGVISGVNNICPSLPKEPPLSPRSGIDFPGTGRPNRQTASGSR